MGSSSAAGSGVGFGFSLGSTWRDAACVRRLNAREMAQTLGDRDAARALMCQDKDVAAAYASVGQSCTQRTLVAVAPPPAQQAYQAPPAETPPNPPVAESHPMQPIPNPPKTPRGDGDSGK
jgi:hypothetical protein